jgi:hypothetical protein
MGLANPAPGHVILDAPNGGEVLQVGSVFTVTWHIQIAHSLQNWDLWYSTTGSGGPWITIVMDLPPGDPSAGSVHTYDWTVPNTPSEQVRVRVRMDNAGTDYYDISNANLTISACSLLGDVNEDGDVSGADIPGFVRAKLGQRPEAGESQACANYGGTLEDDIAAFIADLLTG